jgi:hypothetical protein
MAALFIGSPKAIDFPLSLSAYGRLLETGCHALSEKSK